MRRFIAFTINYAAYFGEIFRGGIQSIERGQYEAASVLGFSKRQTFSRIILPQTVKRVLPATANEVITLVKDTSLAQVVAIVEMFTIAKQHMSGTGSVIPAAGRGRVLLHIESFSNGELFLCGKEAVLL